MTARAGVRRTGLKKVVQRHCTIHSDEPLKAKSCSALASTILSLISIVQKSFAPSFLNQSAGLLPGPLSFIFPNPLIRILFPSTNRYRGGQHLPPSIGKFPDSGIGRGRGRRSSSCGYHRLQLMLWPRRWGWSR